MAWLEFHQDIHIAVGAEIVTQNRAEQSKPFDVVPPAKIGDLLLIQLDSRAHLNPSIQQAPSGDYAERGLRLQCVTISLPVLEELRNYFLCETSLELSAHSTLQ